MRSRACDVTQWAAVRTYFGAIRKPEQLYDFLPKAFICLSRAIHGYCPKRVLFPPTMRLSMTTSWRPHCFGKMLTSGSSVVGIVVVGDGAVVEEKIRPTIFTLESRAVKMQEFYYY